MRISINWLKDFVNISSKIKPSELGDLITLHTAEIEDVHSLAKDFDNIVVGKIKKISKHPDADKLQVTEVEVADGEVLQIVCGASNIYKGMYAPVALVGAKVRWHGEGDLVELESAKLRGVKSNGMLCAGEEIGLESIVDGIMDLSEMKPKAGTPVAELLKLDDVVLEVDNKSLTHRPDLWGHYGIAREVSAILKTPFKKIDPKVKFPLKGESPDIKVEDFELCPRYCGVTIKNVKIEESPDWLKARLTAVGYRPISNIVDITNYVMAELGQPLHAFDKSYIKGGIIVRRAKKDEQMTTLDDQKRKLDTKMLVIADHEKPVAIAGVMGGQNSEINEKTKDIIIESANFNPISIRSTSARLGLRTEAVQRFEKSLDPALAELAIKRTCELVLQLCPDAEIAGPINDVKDYKVNMPVVSLDAEKVSSKIGVKLTADECSDILKRLEFEVKKSSSTTLEVIVPTFRATKDIDIEDDLVEEIVRMYGYENIKPTLPRLPIKVPIINKERELKHKARQFFAWSLGFDEVYNYSFYGDKEIKNTMLEEYEDKHLKMENYLSEDQKYLRVSLLPNILKNVRDNLRYYDSFKIFEIGRTYQEAGEYFPLEEKWICGAVANKSSKSLPFFEVKSAVEEFLKFFTHENATVEKVDENTWYGHPSRTSMIRINGEMIGYMYEPHPSVVKDNDIKAKIACFELNFTRLCKLQDKLVLYETLPKFPGMDIDISVVIGKTKTIQEVTDAIKKTDALIKNIELFDIYEGENIGEENKALAFKILLQSDERTLTDDEMSKVQKKIFGNLEKVGGKIRM